MVLTCLFIAKTIGPGTTESWSLFVTSCLGDLVFTTSCRRPFGKEVYFWNFRKSLHSEWCGVTASAAGCEYVLQLKPVLQASHEFNLVVVQLLSRVWLFATAWTAAHQSSLSSTILEFAQTHVHWEKAMAPHSSTLAWKIPWTEEPGGLQSMGSLRVGHDWATSLSLFTFMCWRRKWQPTPAFLTGESQGRRSLVGCHLWGCTELDTTEAT